MDPVSIAIAQKANKALKRELVEALIALATLAVRQQAVLDALVNNDKEMAKLALKGAAEGIDKFLDVLEAVNGDEANG